MSKRRFVDKEEYEKGREYFRTSTEDGRKLMEQIEDRRNEIEKLNNQLEKKIAQSENSKYFREFLERQEYTFDSVTVKEEDKQVKLILGNYKGNNTFIVDKDYEERFRLIFHHQNQKKAKSLINKYLKEKYEIAKLKRGVTIKFELLK